MLDIRYSLLFVLGLLYLLRCRLLFSGFLHVFGWSILHSWLVWFVSTLRRKVIHVFRGKRSVINLNEFLLFLQFLNMNEFLCISLIPLHEVLLEILHDNSLDIRLNFLLIKIDCIRYFENGLQIYLILCSCVNTWPKLLNAKFFLFVRLFLLTAQVIKLVKARALLQ